MSDRSEPVMFTRQAAELDHAFGRNGWKPDDVKWLSTGDILAKILYVRQGVAEIKVKETERVIDCDGDPFIPYDWSIAPESEQLPNRIRGSFKWDPKAVRLYLSKHQESGCARYISGNKLREELKDMPVLNACILDYLFAHQYLIPEEWKKKTELWETEIFFWGTVYRNSMDGGLYVRCLYWLDGRWKQDFSQLISHWSCATPAALLAS